MNPFQIVIAWLRRMALSMRCLPALVLLRSVVSDARETAKAIFMRSIWASGNGSQSRIKALMFGAVSETRAFAVKQGGFTSVQALLSIFFGIVLVIVLITYMWQTGLPEVISATGNTTALEDAGATASQISWITIFGGLIFLVLLFAVIYFVIKSVGIGGGGGSGGRRRFYRRKRR